MIKIELSNEKNIEEFLELNKQQKIKEANNTGSKEEQLTVSDKEVLPVNLNKGGGFFNFCKLV